MVTVHIAAALSEHTCGARELTVEAATVSEVIEALDRQHPGLRRVLVDEAGLRRFINIYVGDEDIRFLEGLDTVVVDGVEVAIQPAIAGG